MQRRAKYFFLHGIVFRIPANRIPRPLSLIGSITLRCLSVSFGTIYPVGNGIFVATRS